jgi:hypothetical protein
MLSYNIEVTPLPNWQGPLWHCLVSATSPAAAITTLRQATDIPKGSHYACSPALLVIALGAAIIVIAPAERFIAAAD